MQPKIDELEYWLAKEFDYRLNLCVPNVTWGLRKLGHECDLLVLRKSGYACEIEIKRSLADLKADKEKQHNHDSQMIREFWYAIPEEILEKAVEHIQDRAGILLYRKTEKQFSVYDPRKGWRKVQKEVIVFTRKRQPKPNRNARKFTDAERQKLLELASMRVWSMKRKVAKLTAC